MKKILVEKPQQLKAHTLAELAVLLGVSLEKLVTTAKYAETSYEPIRLLKKSGLEYRTIQAPTEELKALQRSVLDKIVSKVPLPPYVYGFGKKGTIVHNAAKHKSHSHLLNVDIKDFFPSVHYKKVHRLFVEMGCNEDIALTLTKLTTLSGSLPQGAPTSPYLASLVLNNLDRSLMNLCKANRLTYTRYFDDISVSGEERAHKVLDTLIKIVKREGYSIHTSGQKIQIFGPSDRKTVTGIDIDLDGNLIPPNSREVMEYLFDLQRKGLKAIKTGNVAKEKFSLRGKIDFIAQVRPRQGGYLKNIYEKILWE